MRGWVVLALAILLAWLALRSILTGRSHRWSIVAVSVMLAVTGVAEIHWQYRAHQYSAILREVSGRDDAYVTCMRLSSSWMDTGRYGGWVMHDSEGEMGREAFLSLQTCQSLNGYALMPGGLATVEQARAVHTLSHEAIHVSGVSDEAVTECMAMQRDAEVARMLGAPPDKARALAELYAGEVYPLLPEQYRSVDCVSDGPMDQTPGDGVWP